MNRHAILPDCPQAASTSAVRNGKCIMSSAPNVVWKQKFRLILRRTVLFTAATATKSKKAFKIKAAAD